jgi:hypothetical protein
MAFEEQEVFPGHRRGADPRRLAGAGRGRAAQARGDPVFGRRVQREFRNMARKLRRSLRRGVERRAVADWVSIEALLEAYEVLSMASQSGRSVTRDRCAPGSRGGLHHPGSAAARAAAVRRQQHAADPAMAERDAGRIYRDAAVDLLRINRERKDRLRLLRSAGRP